MSGPRLVTGNEEIPKTPQLVTGEPSFVDQTRISKFPQYTQPSAEDANLYGIDLSLPGSTVEERQISQRMRDQIPGYVRSFAEMYPAVAMQNPQFLARLGMKAGAGRLAAGAYMALHSRENVEHIVFGVPSSQDLKYQRAMLVIDPNRMQREIARMDNERQNFGAIAGGPEGAAFGRMLNSRVPATADDVLRELDAKIIHQVGEEGAATQRDHEDALSLHHIANTVLSHTPETSRISATFNVARNIASMVGARAIYVFGAQVANDFRNAVSQSNNPNVSAEEAADTWGQAFQGGAMLLPLGRNRAERVARAKVEQDRTQQTAANTDATEITTQLNLMRQAQEKNTPKKIISLDEPRANLVATLRQAHQDLAPDGVTVIPGVDNPMELLKPNPVIRQVMADRMAYHSKSKTVFLFGENNTDNTSENRESIRKYGFYPGQRVSYAGNDFSFVGGLERGMVRIQEPLQEALPMQSRIQNALTEVRSLGYENPLNSREVVFGDAVVEVSSFDGRLTLSSIRSLDPGKGNASKALDRILAIADKHNIPIDLYAKRIGSKGMGEKKLKEWYSRHGFVAESKGSGDMTREPVTNEVAPIQHSVRVKDLRLSGQNDNLTLNPVSQDAAFRLYQQLKASQPGELGPREVDALMSSMGELLALPKSQWGALREYLLAREASSTPRINPEIVAQIDTMLKDVMSPEELDAALEEGRIGLSQPITEATGELEVPDMLRRTPSSGTVSAKGRVYSIVTPSALPSELKTQYESLQHTREMLEYESVAETFTRMQSGILIEHTLDNIAASNNLSVKKNNDGYDIRGVDGELVRHITSPEEAADFVNSIQQPSGPELVPELNIPPFIIPPEVKAMIASNNDPSFVPYQPTEHSLAERILTNLRRQLFEGAMRQAKDISAITKGKVDLETLARMTQQAAKLTDALIRHEEVKAGVDKLEQQERALTRQQRDDAFRANETLSVKEAEDLAGSVVTKYADMIMGLNDNTAPIDIRRLVELSRFVDELQKRAKKEGMSKAEYESTVKKLYDSYDLTDNNKMATLFVEAMRKKDRKEAALHDLVRLVEARQNPHEAMSRDEFMSKNGFNSIQRTIADKAKKVLSYFADYNGLDREAQITQYMAHYRSQPRLLDEHLASSESRGSAEEGPAGIHSFEDMVRSGELSVYETSPSRMLKRYIRSSVMRKHMKPIYDGLVNEMNDQINSIDDPDVKKLAKRWMIHFTEGIVRNLDIEDRVHNKLFKTLANEFASKLPEKLRGPLLRASDRAITNLVNTSIYNMISAYQGGKIGNVPRDIFNALQMTNTWFGPRVALDILNRSFGDVKIDANGFSVGLEEKAARGRAQGIIGQEFLKRKPPIPKDHRNPMIALGEAYNTFANAAIALSGQQITHDLLSIGVFEHGHEKALRVIEELRTMDDLTPEKKTKHLDDHLDLDMFSPEFQKHFDSLLRSGTESDILAAAKAYGVEMVQKIMPPYGYGEQPRGWRTVPGRLFGLYGRYQIHILDQLHDMVGYGRTNAKKRAALERFLGVEVLRSTVSSALGVDSSNWSALGLWQGSPQYQFASDLISAIRKQDENALANVLTQIGASQIPMSSLVQIMNSSSSTEEALMKILTLIKPAK